ncbi:MAG TPA: sterol desaturase family protein [Verrucomicrobiae bacterium]|nr:sterol desaturase family protein [Verrucomicrobiae bacterium]
MSKLHEIRMKVRGELEVPPALRHFGSGWISGVLGLVLGIAGLLLVISLWAPGVFALPETQPLRSNPWFRVGLHVLLLAAFGLSALSLALRKDRTLGTCGVAVTLLAALIGGSQVTAAVPEQAPLFFGLDFFVLRILFTGFLFIPLERIFSHRDEQPVFREEWREDLFYYLVSSLMVQVLTFLTFAPAKSILALATLTDVRAWVGSLPFVVQLVAIMFLTDLVQYWVHRAFHRIPWLWKFHAVHHSARSMDWMAGARMHFLEILALRSTTVIPMFVLGFSVGAMNTYILVVYLYSTFVHANLNWRFPLTEKLLVTPRFHHWHHGIEREAVDVNFAIHFPLFDRLFGTYHLPKDKWPSGYGLEGHPVPLGYWAQFKYPFRRKPKMPAAPPVS